MSDTPTPQSLAVKDIQKSLSEIWNREKAYVKACEEDAEAEHTYKIAKATAFLASEGTEKAREAQSVVDTNESFLKHLKAKAKVMYMKEKLKDAQQALIARQSILSFETKSNQNYQRTGT
jgi:hypothetical protein